MGIVKLALQPIYAIPVQIPSLLLMQQQGVTAQFIILTVIMEQGKLVVLVTENVLLALTVIYATHANQG